MADSIDLNFYFLLFDNFCIPRVVYSLAKRIVSSLESATSYREDKRTAAG